MVHIQVLSALQHGKTISFLVLFIHKCAQSDSVAYQGSQYFYSMIIAIFLMLRKQKKNILANTLS